VLLFGALAGGCGRAPVEVYADLLGEAERSGAVSSPGLGLYTWSLGSDRRPLLFQHPPSRLALRAGVSGRDCRLRFAIGLNEPARERSDGVLFRVSWDTAGGAPLFEEWVDPHRAAPGWLDREVRLGEVGDPAASLVLETGVGPAGSRTWDHAGWASPHVVCRVPARDRRPLPRPHVILISIDTLRADRLGLYGASRDTSPVLDALARESLVFERAFTPAPWTLPAHASLFTGLEPRQHGAGHASPWDPLPPGVPTLAERLRDAGYETVAFSAGGMVTRRNGLDRGFERWSEWTRANLPSVLPAVFGALAPGATRPVFLFLHTYDVHAPYFALPGEPAFTAEDPGQGLAPGEWERIRGLPYHDYHLLQRFRGLGDVLAAYDSGIRFVDAALGALFERMRAIGAFENSLILVVSDHGESLYDRALYLGHSFTLYDEEIRVPLLVRYPGSTRRGRTAELASLVDIMPLVLEAVGLEVPEGASGGNPLPRIDGAETSRARVDGEAAHTGARYVRSASAKAIAPAIEPTADSRLPGGLRDRFVPELQLFDLDRDPGEEHNLAARAAAGRDGALEELVVRAAALPLPGLRPDPVPVAGSEEEPLRALGYVE
jgi:arylsulfatase A-like enzyme